MEYIIIINTWFIGENVHKVRRQKFKRTIIAQNHILVCIVPIRNHHIFLICRCINIHIETRNKIIFEFYRNFTLGR